MKAKIIYLGVADNGRGVRNAYAIIDDIFCYRYDNKILNTPNWSWIVEGIRPSHRNDDLLCFHRHQRILYEQR